MTSLNTLRQNRRPASGGWQPLTPSELERTLLVGIRWWEDLGCRKALDLRTASVAQMADRGGYFWYLRDLARANNWSDENGMNTPKTLLMLDLSNPRATEAREVIASFEIDSSGWGAALSSGPDVRVPLRLEGGTNHRSLRGRRVVADLSEGSNAFAAWDHAGVRQVA